MRDNEREWPLKEIFSPLRKSFTDESVPLHSTLKETEDGKLKRIKALYFTSVLDEINIESHTHQLQTEYDTT
jgi:hypothetical protein